MIEINKNSSIRIKENNVTVYIDPWDYEYDNDADYIFVTHDHFDHYDAKTINRLSNKSTQIVVPTSIKDIVLKDLDEKQVLFVEANKQYELNDICFTPIKGYNNAPTVFHPIEKGYLGYLININNTKYYITSDSDNTVDARGVKCDVLLVPIGSKYTMNIDEAIELTNIINPKLVIPTHYGDVIGNKEDGNTFKEKLLKVNPNIKANVIL